MGIQVQPNCCGKHVYGAQLGPKAWKFHMDSLEDVAWSNACDHPGLAYPNATCTLDVDRIHRKIYAVSAARSDATGLNTGTGRLSQITDEGVATQIGAAFDNTVWTNSSQPNVYVCPAQNSVWVYFTYRFNFNATRDAVFFRANLDGSSLAEVFRLKALLTETDRTMLPIGLAQHADTGDLYFTARVFGVSDGAFKRRSIFRVGPTGAGLTELVTIASENNASFNTVPQGSDPYHPIDIDESTGTLWVVGNTDSDSRGKIWKAPIDLTGGFQLVHQTIVVAGSHQIYDMQFDHVRNRVVYFRRYGTGGGEVKHYPTLGWELQCVTMKPDGTDVQIEGYVQCTEASNGRGIRLAEDWYPHPRYN